MIRNLVASFTVPGQPVPKERPRHGNGRTYTPTRTREAEVTLAWLYRAAAPKGLGAIPRGTDVEFELEFYFSDGRYGDLDNCEKLVSDALNKVAYEDDKQIAKVVKERWIDKANPRTVVRLYYREETP